MNVLEEACTDIAKRTGVPTYPRRMDIISTEEINVLVKDVVKKFGRIDILVNNAGVGDSEKPILQMTEEAWDSTVAMDLRGIFLMY